MTNKRWIRLSERAADRFVLALAIGFMALVVVLALHSIFQSAA